MFHFPAFPPHALCVQARVTAHDDCRVSPFGHPRITAWLTTPRGLSRPPTSFIGSWCQGIHRAPLKSWPQMLASTMQFSNNQHPRKTPHTLVPRKPNSVPDPANPSHTFHAEAVLVPTSQPCRIVNVPPMSTSTGHAPMNWNSWTAHTAKTLLRKEVIQPHLPVRLPCYDFVPIASPTFDDSLPNGLGHRLRVLPTFVT
jgi:hypothetical protein